MFLVLLNFLTLSEYETCLVKHQCFVLLAKINDGNDAVYLVSLCLSKAPFNLCICTLRPVLTSQNGFVFFLFLFCCSEASSLIGHQSVPSNAKFWVDRINP